MNSSATPSSHRLKEGLPPEIWSLIILNLTRRYPSPNTREISTYVDYRHQNDLTTCMLVNSTFHAITAPILYSEVYVYSPLQFLYGLEEAVQLQDHESHLARLGKLFNDSLNLLERKPIGDIYRPRRHRKCDLLKLTCSLNLLYRPARPPTIPDDQTDMTKPVENNVNEIETELVRDAVQECTELCSATEVLERFMRNEKEVFPKLARISTGMVSDVTWVAIDEIFISRGRSGRGGLSMPLAGLLFKASSFVLLLMRISCLRFFCQHSSLGPYAISANRTNGNDEIPTVNSAIPHSPAHHRPCFVAHVNRRIQSAPPILYRWNNIVSFDRKSRTDYLEYFKQSELADRLGEYYLRCQLPVNHPPTSSNTDHLTSSNIDHLTSSNTYHGTLDIYGLMRFRQPSTAPTSSSTYINPAFLSDDPDQRRVMIEEQREWDAMTAEGRAASLADIMWARNPSRTQDLRNATTIHLPNDIYECLGCGSVPDESCYIL